MAVCIPPELHCHKQPATQSRPLYIHAMKRPPAPLIQRPTGCDPCASEPRTRTHSSSAPLDATHAPVSLAPMPAYTQKRKKLEVPSEERRRIN